jgi:DDE superfamily endonuclease
MSWLYRRIHADQVEDYAFYIYEKSIEDRDDIEVDKIWGFVDGTLRPCCRPCIGQKQLYSGHKRTHGIKFQGVVAPDGMIVFLYGPECGNRRDSVLWHDSGLRQMLEDIMPEDDPDNIYKLYGDPAYQGGLYLDRPYRNPAPGSLGARINTKMSTLRQCIEWTFGNLVTFYGFLSWRREMKIFHKPIAKYYVVACFLWNLHSTFVETKPRATSARHSCQSKSIWRLLIT